MACKFSMNSTEVSRISILEQGNDYILTDGKNSPRSSVGGPAEGQ